MSKSEALSAAFKAEMNKLHLHFHEELYDAIVKHLGASIHDEDAHLVACSDPQELETIKKNFLVGKLGMNADDPRLDEAIQEVCHGLGKSNNKKHRTTFYYLLTAILNKESVFLEKS
jgi:hypothetical protein